MTATRVICAAVSMGIQLGPIPIPSLTRSERRLNRRSASGTPTTRAPNPSVAPATAPCPISCVFRDFYLRPAQRPEGLRRRRDHGPSDHGLLRQVCGSTLARAHARSGDRVAIAAYLGGSDAFDHALAEFSEAFADQNERDFNALVQAEKDGRITAQRGL